MIERFATTFLILLMGTVFVATAAPSALADEEAEAVVERGRRVDIEAGVGVLIGLSDGVDRTIDVGGGFLVDRTEFPVTNDFAWNFSTALELKDRWDLEFGYQQVETSDGFTDDSRSVNYVNLGVRYNKIAPNSAEADKKRAIPYLVVGFSWIEDLIQGKQTDAMYAGPAVRIRSGASSGFIIKAPVYWSVSGSTLPHVIPSINWFYEFNFRDGGLKSRDS